MRILHEFPARIHVKGRAILNFCEGYKEDPPKELQVVKGTFVTLCVRSTGIFLYAATPQTVDTKLATEVTNTVDLE